MSYETAAERAMEEVRGHVQESVRLLAHLVAGDVVGWGEYGAAQQGRVVEWLQVLAKLRAEIG